MRCYPILLTRLGGSRLLLFYNLEGKLLEGIMVARSSVVGDGRLFLPRYAFDGVPMAGLLPTDIMPPRQAFGARFSFELQFCARCVDWFHPCHRPPRLRVEISPCGTVVLSTHGCFG